MSDERGIYDFFAAIKKWAVLNEKRYGMEGGRFAIFWVKLNIKNAALAAFDAQNSRLISPAYSLALNAAVLE
ncbi:hypothetical protein C9I43_12935 [Shewanella morhuae]|uniref:Uncharacterized protein n=1 Tax=Shewanella morhuae TaxID=365591 RepID=A0ABX5HY09_9GAMM|nr:hypothetical protein C9I43_12935 [Shewanella morhuae]